MTTKRIPGAHKRGFELSANFLVILILSIVIFVGSLVLLYQFCNTLMK